MANKAIKYRVYPTTEQSIMFAKTFGCCRKVYNLMLSDKIDGYKATGKFPTVTPAKYKDDYPYLREVDAKRKMVFLNSSLPSIAVSPILQTIKKVQLLS